MSLEKIGIPKHLNFRRCFHQEYEVQMKTRKELFLLIEGNKNICVQKHKTEIWVGGLEI